MSSDRDVINARRRAQRLKAREAKFGAGAPDQRGRHNNHASGQRHPRWNDDKILSSHGYVKIRVGVDHALADPNGYAYEHLLVWIEAGRPKPEDGFILHHKNENKQDNNICNLEVLTDVDHAKRHFSMLPDSDVYDIRVKYHNRIANTTQLAREYGVPPERISRFIKGATRKCAGGPIFTGARLTRTPEVKVG